MMEGHVCDDAIRSTGPCMRQCGIQKLQGWAKTVWREQQVEGRDMIGCEVVYGLTCYSESPGLACQDCQASLELRLRALRQGCY